MDTSILTENETLVSMGLAKTKSCPAFPASGTLPMITVRRAAFPPPPVLVDSRKPSRAARAPRPPMPVLLAPRPSTPSLSTVVVIHRPKMVPRVLAAMVGFVLALVVTSVAMRVPSVTGSTAQASVVR